MYYDIIIKLTEHCACLISTTRTSTALNTFVPARHGFLLAIKITALVMFTDILTVAQVAVISYQTIPQYWYRNNKDATGKGGDHKCFGPCNMC